jgi:hypothetical protein
MRVRREASVGAGRAVARRIKWVELNRPLWGLYQAGGETVRDHKWILTRGGDQLHPDEPERLTEAQIAHRSASCL